MESSGISTVLTSGESTGTLLDIPVKSYRSQVLQIKLFSFTVLDSNFSNSNMYFYFATHLIAYKVRSYILYIYLFIPVPVWQENNISL